jgi:reactive chlorine resistance protein C
VHYAHNRENQMLNILNNHTLETRLAQIGLFVLRFSLVFFFVGFGIYKFTPQEAAGVAPLMAHSPFLFWVNPAFGERGGSAFIGVIEISLGVLIALRRVSPSLSALGSALTALALLVTLSFLFTTPGLDPQSSDAGFLLKDLTLFGAALWTTSEAMAAARMRRAQVSEGARTEH